MIRYPRASRSIFANAGTSIDARIIYCGTFSKTLARGLRTGWVCASREVIRKIILIKQAADLHCLNVQPDDHPWRCGATLSAAGRKLIAEYSMRRDAMVKALAAYMAGGVTWSAPQGGMFVADAAAVFDAGQLLSDVLRRERIAFVPGAAFYAGRSKTNNLRLSFALQPSLVIDNGIARIARVPSRLFGQRPLRCARLEEHVGKLPLQVFSGNFNGVHESGDAAIGDDLTIALEAPAKLGTSARTDLFG